MTALSRQTERTIAILLRCQAMCFTAAMTRHLEGLGHGVSGPQHVRLMMDCAAVCAFTASLLAHKSQFQSPVCTLCADICETCAKDCDQLENFEDCAAVCREAAAVCLVKARPDHAEVLEMASRLPPTP